MVGRTARSPFAPAVPGSAAALPWARLGAGGWDRSVDMASSCPLSVGLLEITLGGHPFSPRSWCPTWMGHPRTGLLCAWCPTGPRDTLGCCCSQLPHRCTQTREQGGGVPKGPLLGRAVWQGRRLHLPHPHPRSLSKHPVPPSVPLVAEWGRTPSLSPTLPRQQPHAASPATPQTGPVGAG